MEGAHAPSEGSCSGSKNGFYYGVLWCGLIGMPPAPAKKGEPNFRTYQRRLGTKPHVLVDSFGRLRGLYFSGE